MARTTPPYLLCWLALAALGAITVPTDPVGTQAELAALVGQVEPRLTVEDEVTIRWPATGGWSSGTAGRHRWTSGRTWRC
ncbi:MAG: hypothetical protein ACR2JK_08955 [Geodermatophilaceae bacterium]